MFDLLGLRRRPVPQSAEPVREQEVSAQEEPDVALELPAEEDRKAFRIVISTGERTWLFEIG